VPFIGLAFSGDSLVVKVALLGFTVEKIACAADTETYFIDTVSYSPEVAMYLPGGD